MNPTIPTRLCRTIAACLAVALAGEVTAETPESGTYQIMNDSEVRRHADAKRTLSDPAWERYRNVQYAQLQRRAAADGYRLPATPPWGESSYPAAPDTPDMQAEAAARHAQMRQRMQQQSRPEPPPRPEPAPQSAMTLPVAPAPTEDTPTLSPEPAPAQAGAPTETLITESTLPPANTESLSAAADAVGNDTQTASETAPSAESQLFVPAHDVSMPSAPAAATTSDSGDTQPVVTDTSAATGSSTDIEQYREAMRTRFDEYMKERQAQREEAMRLQREKREAAMEKSRAQFNRYPPPGYPTGPGYGPRYPAAFPGYRTPYWQQPQR